jgi:cytochrome c-type biogenesis protein CcmE
MTRKQRRLSVIAGLGAVVIVAFGLILLALRDQIVFFYSPSEIHDKAVAVGTPVRLGGLVKAGSWTHQGDRNDFVVTDGKSEMVAHYTGILPDLFREG